MNEDSLLELARIVTRSFEMAGILAILMGAIFSAALFVRDVARGHGLAAYKTLRSNIGRSILLGLELLVAADIINTVAIDPTLDSLAVLAGIVLIRTFLSFALEIEIAGRWPWKKAQG